MEAGRRKTFQDAVWSYYRAHGRHDLPWRQFEPDGSLDPYKVLVSESMLQQTQVGRVIPKFTQFMELFPDAQSLAKAPLAKVLKTWSGLGYNRRAKFLWQTAEAIVGQHNGRLPSTLAELIALPGIGPNTAGALLAYAYNKPVVFVETNIRTVFIYHFFASQEQVSDKDIADLAAETLPDDPRHWYWALMDYGTNLKQTIGNLNRLSRHYTKQSVFHGSRRQIRGQVLRLLADKALRLTEIQQVIHDERLLSVLADLEHEGLVTKHGPRYKLAGA
jgi:A/G-specific adenine glycosylase